VSHAKKKCDTMKWCLTPVVGLLCMHLSHTAKQTEAQVSRGLPAPTVTLLWQAGLRSDTAMRWWRLSLVTLLLTATSFGNATVCSSNCSHTLVGACMGAAGLSYADCRTLLDSGRVPQMVSAGCVPHCSVRYCHHSNNSSLRTSASLPFLIFFNGTDVLVAFACGPYHVPYHAPRTPQS
jgi:hypothetical protein